MFASTLLLAAMVGQEVAAQRMPATRFKGFKEKVELSATESQAPRKAMKRLTSGGSDVYGYVGYDTYYDQNDWKHSNIGALCNFGPTNYTVKWIDPMWNAEMSVMRTGYLVYDSETDKYQITGTVPVYYTGNPDIISVCYYTYDFETGKFLGPEFPAFSKPYFLCAAYNEDDGYVYGLAEYLKSAGGASFYGRAKIGSLSNIKEIAPLDDNHAFISICWNCDDGYIYGILSDGTMMRVDKDGKTTAVAKFDKYIGPWQTGLAYSPVEKLFYWNVNFEDGRSSLYTIDINAGDPGKGKFTYLYDFPNEEEFYFFLTTDRKADEQAPAVAGVKEVSFPEGATSGTVSFEVPTMLNNGNSIPAGTSLRYQAMLDGSEYSGGTAEPGEVVTLEFIDLTEDMHNFSFTTSIDGRQSLAAAREVFIGVDTPLAPENVELTEERVAWEAVTEGVHGGWINMADMEYQVYVDDQFMGATKDYQLDITIPASTEIHNFTASVIAVAGGKSSEPGISNEIVAGKPLSLPVFFAPTANDAVTATYYDVNGDGNGWIYAAPSEAWVCLHSLQGEGDDWLFLPPIEIKDAAGYYVLSFDSKIVNTQYPAEYMEVKIGKSRNTSDMTGTVMAKFTPAADYATYQALVKVDEPGAYYIGFHYVSDAMQNGIYLKNVGIAGDALAATTPAYAENIKGVPGEKGALEAEITFTMPVKTINGADIAAGTQLTAKVSAESEASVTGTPGSEQTVKVQTVQGMNSVKVQVADGDKVGLEAVADVWTGIDIPDKVINLTAEPSRDLMGIYLKWEKPTVGIHGGWVGDDDMDYDIYRYMITLLGPNWEKVGSAGKDMEYLYTFKEGTPQDLYPIGVRPINAAGKPSYVTFTAQVAGMPYTLPMEENFATYENDFSIFPWIIMNPSASYTGSWSVAPISDYDSSQEGYLFVASGARGSKAQVAVPRFSTKGAKDLDIYFLLYGGEDMTGMDILASSYDNPEPVKIGSVPANKTEGFYEARVAIPAEFLDKEWVAIYYDVTFGNQANLMGVRRMVVGDPTGVNTIADNGGFSVMAGEGTVTVFGAEGETIDIYATDGRKVASASCASAAETFRLASGIYIVRGVKVVVK